MQMARMDDATARGIGLGVFLLGIVFLIVVFVLAFRDLAGAGVLGQLASPTAPREPGAVWWTLAVKGVLFFLMIYAGSAVAGRGIGLYAASRAPHEV